MNFETYSERLATLPEFYPPKKIKKITQKRSQVVNESMRMKSVNKTQFAGLNNKRYYFPDGIVYLPFGHFLLEKVRKKKKKKIVQNYILKLKKELEAKGVHLCERLRILRSIYSQPPMLYQLNSSLIATFVALKIQENL